MPIAGLTRTEAGFPRLGKIRKGDEKTGNRIGKDLDYFRVVSDRPGLADKIRELYGNQPKEIKVWLPYATPQENFDPWMKEYGTSGLKRKCDGVNQHLWLSESGSTYESVDQGFDPKPCIVTTGGKCACQRTAPLKVILPELFALGHAGYLEVVTSSKHDILTIQAAISQAFAMKQDLIGVPFRLTRQSEEKSYPKENGRGKKTYSLIGFEVDPMWLAKQFRDRYAQNMALPAAAEVAQIEPAMTYAAVQSRMAEVKLKSAAPSTALQKRIAAAAKLTGHTREQMKAIAATAELPASSADFVEGDDSIMVGRLFADFMAGDPDYHAEFPFEKRVEFAYDQCLELSAQNLSDAEIWQKLNQKAVPVTAEIA